MSALNLKMRRQGFFLVLGLGVLLLAWWIMARPDHAQAPFPKPALYVSQPVSPVAPQVAQPRLREASSHLPLAFIPNRGQRAPQVAYYAQGPDSAISFTPEGVVFDFVRREPPKPDRSIIQPVSFPPPNQGEAQGEAVLHRLRLNQTFVGANPHAKIEAQHLQPGKVSLLRGHDPATWLRGLPTYGAVTYRDLYPGVDLTYTGKAGQLKYEFHIQPGANPNTIQVAYAGAQGLTISDTGDLHLMTAWGPLTDTRPVSYQEIKGRRVPVASRFRLINAGTYGFEVEGHDPRYPLLIDPGLVYSTYIGGVGFDDVTGIAVDPDGNAYVTGKTHSPDFPTTPGAFDPTFDGNEAYVAKLSPDGSTLLYATYLGGPVEPFGIAVDKHGHAYVVGRTYSPDLPTTPKAFDTTFNGGSDHYVVKLSRDGDDLVYATYLGGSGNEQDGGGRIRVDRKGQAYVEGVTSSADFPTTPDAFGPTYNGGSEDVYVAKLSKDGKRLIYATYIGGNGDDDVKCGLAVAESLDEDEDGSAYVAGTTTSTNFPTTPGVVQPMKNSGSGRDAFALKLSPDGKRLVYSTHLGGSGDEIGFGISVDPKGNAYVGAVTFNSADLPTTPNAFDRTYNGRQDAYVAKLSPDGKRLIYATYLGGSLSEGGGGFVVDREGHLYVSGFTDSPDFPTTLDAFQSTFHGGSDVYLVKLSKNGKKLLYGTFIGGSSSDGRGGFSSASGVDMALLERKKKEGEKEEEGRVHLYIAGVTVSQDFPTTAGAYSTTPKGSQDLFILQFDPGRGPGPHGDSD